MIEYIVGPVIAVLVSMKFTDYKAKELRAECKRCCDRLEVVEKQLIISDEEALKKMMITVTPIAKAVKQLQETVGV
jgi:gas vesicle protein|tara:strand:+ start:488 stop:715 length:228 start_codon:yes stop_codon:yes gene_type:complete